MYRSLSVLVSAVCFIRQIFLSPSALPTVEMFKTRHISALQNLIELKISFIVPALNGISYNCKFAFIEMIFFLRLLTLNIDCIHWICCYIMDVVIKNLLRVTWLSSLVFPGLLTTHGWVNKYFCRIVFWNIFSVCYKYFLLTGSDSGHSADYSSCLVR